MSETQNGPPLRFKAVDPETGREGRDFSFYLVHGIRVLSEDASTWEPRTKGMLCSFSTQEPIICQFTGETDRDGAELFGGDVLAFLFPEMDPRLFVIGYHEGCFGLYHHGGEHDGDWYCSLQNAVHSDSYLRLGNRWESADTLRQRAEKLSASKGGD